MNDFITPTGMKLLVKQLQLYLARDVTVDGSCIPCYHGIRLLKQLSVYAKGMRSLEKTGVSE